MKAIAEGFEFAVALPFLMAGWVASWIKDQYGRGCTAYWKFWVRR